MVNEKCMICNVDLDEIYAGVIWDLAADICTGLNIDVDDEGYGYGTAQERIYNYIRSYLSNSNYCPNCGRKHNVKGGKTDE